jgi:predicted DNA binding CopG/RHH family protein
MKNSVYLDQEEQELIESIHRDNYRQPSDMAVAMQEFSSLVEKTITKKKAVSIRLLESDIQKIKAKAIREGIPYQTLISSLIHKYANDSVSFSVR